MQTNVLTDRQYTELPKRLIEGIEQRYKSIPLNSLKHPQYILKKPLYITLETDENDKVIASLDEIEAFAYADTEFEAINLLCEEIINLYEDLKDSSEDLGVLPRKWLQYLKEVIEKR
ncbi:MAG: hypothetical protein ABIF11_07395 [Nitrospirota bacterium]